jgi:hypothetical protein
MKPTDDESKEKQASIRPKQTIKPLLTPTTTLINARIASEIFWR